MRELARTPGQLALCRRWWHGWRALVLCVACSGVNEPAPSGTRVTISPAGRTELRARATLQATASAIDGERQLLATFKWQSADTSVATVDANGRVFARAVGETTIGAWLPSGEGAQFTLRVIPTEARVSTASPLLELLSGDTSSVPLTAYDDNGRDIASELTWESGNTAVATVAADGRVTAINPGASRVTVHWKTLSAEFVVHVPRTAASRARIKLIFSGVPDWLQADATEAARIWESVLLAELPPVRLTIPDGRCNGQNFSPYGLPPIDHVETGVTLFVFVAKSDAIYPRATGGQCVRRFPDYTTLFGTVVLGSLGVAAGRDDYPWVDLLVHEMGHTLGLVGSFSQYGFNDPPFVTGRVSRFGDVFHWTGEFARLGRQLVTGTRTSAVPAEFSGHWAFSGDIMSNRAGERVFITSTTIGALLDIGYPTAMSRANLDPLCYGTTCP